MTIDEKISHIVDRIKNYENGNVETFEDVESLVDIEYSTLFFVCMSYINSKNKFIARKIINDIPTIGQRYINLLRGDFVQTGENWFARDKNDENLKYCEKFMNGDFNANVENNGAVKEYVSDK
jgi:hypothetical protein